MRCTRRVVSLSVGLIATLAGCLSATYPYIPDAGASADGGIGSDSGMGSDAGGTDSGSTTSDGGACTTACDCAPGLACGSGQCVVGFAAVYCCDSATCPSGSICQSRDGRFSVCAADAGTPTPDAGYCQTACDCSPGLSCLNGQCIAAPQPEYCCASPKCPSGASCQNPDGTYSQCGVTTVDAGNACPNCQSWFECCGPQCVNFDNDPFNCGGCGIVCSGTTPYCANRTCQAPPCFVDGGACATPEGICCGGTCCNAGDLCCELDGPIAGAVCYTPTPQQPTCPLGCPVCG